MPFKSKAQKEFMMATHPDIAKRWMGKYGPGKGLPEHVKPPTKGAIQRRLQPPKAKKGKK